MNCKYILAVKTQGNPICISIHKTNEERLEKLDSLKKIGNVECFTLGYLQRNTNNRWKVVDK